jgi:hypothetical protein
MTGLRAVHPPVWLEWLEHRTGSIHVVKANNSRPVAGI